MPFCAQIAAAIAPLLGVEAAQIESLFETPPTPEMGDYGLPCFAFAKILRKSPQSIAEQLVQAPLPAFVAKTEAVGGYANFFLDKQVFARSVLETIKAQGDRYGAQNIGQGRNVCIDYSSINIAKPFHIGHLSSTAIGHALYNLYGFMGYTPVGINHLGDWGTQFGKLLAAYELWGEGIDIEAGGVDAMLSLYVKFHEQAEQDEGLNDLARNWFLRIEEGDAQALSLFERFKEATIKEVMGLYKTLGIEFDSFAGESFYNDKMQPVVDELKAKGLLEQSNGAYIVDLTEEKMPPCIILRSDGATLYATRDLAAAFYRKQTYDFAKCLYVVAYQQNLHFQQLFAVLGKMGYEWAQDLEHVAFGMVSLEEGGTLSTRRGNVVKLEEVLARAVKQARDILEEKSPNLEAQEKDAVAQSVGVGAVVFGVLYNSRIKDITFSFKRALSFDGETAPYLQYTHARCCSLLRRGQALLDKPQDDKALDNDYAMAVVSALSAYPQALNAALEKNEPYLIARSLMDIAQAYNRLYYQLRILDEEDEAGSAARLALSDAVRTVIRRGLALLGIQAPERM